jgi:diguanylate cyclase (GGDEF)-like protein/PAS domain S-box-containing protein
MIAALLPVLAMDMAVLKLDLSHARPGVIEAIVIGSGVGAGLLGLVLGWVMSGMVVRYANERVAEATGELVDLKHALELERDRLAYAMEGSRLAMWELDMVTGDVKLSANWATLMGAEVRDSTIPIAELIDRVPPEEQADCWQAVRAVMRGKSDFYDIEHRVRRNDGTMLWIRSRGAVSARAEGRVLRMTGTNFDITARKQAELAMQESEAKLRLIADNLPVMVVYADRDLRFLFANRLYLEFFGVTLDQVLGRRLGEIAGETAESLIRSKLRVLARGETVTFERERPDRAGDMRHYEVRVIPNRHGDELVGFFTVIQDVTQRELTTRLFEQMALTDPLTGLPNKRLLLDRLERAISQSARRPGDVALLFVDLDGFKAVNDSRGHAAGDAVLNTVAQRLRACARASDTVARYGGDEFVVLLEACRSQQDAEAVAMKISASLSQPYPLEHGAVEISCSIGIASHPRDGEHPDMLLQHADAAMYRAKKAGKNRFAVYADAPA